MRNRFARLILLRKLAKRFMSMTVDQVLRLQNAAPSTPYWIRLADGKGITVKDPDFVSISGPDEIISVDDEKGGVDLIDLALVISLRYGTPPAETV
jgi:hypothetical protein